MNDKTQEKLAITGCLLVVLLLGCGLVAILFATAWAIAT